MTESEIRWLESRFDGIKDTIELNLKPICDELHDHKETLYGNGKDGLKVIVDRIDQTIKGMKQSRKTRLALWLLAFGAGMGGAVNFIIALGK